MTGLQFLWNSYLVAKNCNCEFQPRSAAGLDTIGVGSFDPNELTGATGFGPLRYLSATVPLPYTATFVNLESATAPAQKVVVSDPLDAGTMDLSTLQLGPITFGNRTVTPPLGAKAFATTVDLRPERNLLVRIDAGLDPESARGRK